MSIWGELGKIAVVVIAETVIDQIDKNDKS